MKFILLISLLFVLSSCEYPKTNKDISSNIMLSEENITQNTTNNTDTNTIRDSVKRLANYEYDEEIYTSQDGIRIKYPHIKNIENEKFQNEINNLIKKFVINMVDASQKDFTNEPSASIDMSFEIVLQTDSILSMVFTGYFYSKNSYPIFKTFSLNLDMANSQIIELGNVIELNESFVTFIRNKNLSFDMFDDSQGEEVKETYYLSEFVDLDNMKTYSNFYLKKDALVISIVVPHALGDHKEFEIKYIDINEHINKKGVLWKNLNVD